MSKPGQVDLIFRYRIKPGQEERFQAYLDKVLSVTEAQEPYVLEYQIFRQADGSYLQHERYESEEAVARHLALTAEGQADFHAAAEIIDVMAVGELKQSFWDQFDGPQFFRYARFREVAR